MGRNVTSDTNFEYPFALGEQDSNFGDVLDMEIEGYSISRFIGTQGQGEKIDMSIGDINLFLSAMETKIEETEDKNDKEMIKLFCEHIRTLAETHKHWIDLELYVEY